MSRLRWILPLVFLVSSAACKKKQQDEPAPTKPSDAGKLPDRGSAEVLPAQKVTQLGDALAADPAAAAGAPALAIDHDGAPITAWVEAGKVQVRRWDGKAWTPVGAPPNETTHRAKGVPSLAVEQSGGVLLAWIETNAKDVDLLQTARWLDGTWKPVGELGTLAVVDGTVAISAVGPVVLWRETGATAGQFDVHLSVLGASGWAPLGDGILRGAPDATVRTAPALGARAGGPLVVGWIERSPAPTLHLRRWDAAASKWETLPPLEGVDGDSTLTVTTTPDGTVYANVSFVSGLRQIAALPVGAGGWNQIGVPEAANGQVIGQRLGAGDDGRVVFTYPYGGRYGYWDGRRWSPTSVGVISPSTVVPVAAVGKDNRVYVAWSDSAPGSKEPERVRVYVVE